MKVQIDRRPIWFIIIVRSFRPAFFLALGLLFFYLINLPTPDGLTIQGQRAIAIFLLCIILWVSNVVPLAITGLFAIALVPFLDVLPQKSTYAHFGNEAVFFILGAFILAGAVMHSGLSKRLALNILERFGGSPRRLLIGVFLLAAALSLVMSEHAVAAMLFPIVLEISKALNLRPGTSNYGRLLFFALAWGCVIGGVGTFLGGARVPLAVGMLKEATGATIGFLDYLIAVFPLVVILLLIGYMVLTRFFPIDITGVESAHGVLAKRIKELGRISFNEYGVGIISVLTIAAWMIFGDKFGLASIALCSVVTLFVFRLVRWKDVEENVNWGIILMYGGAIVLGAALDKSGAASWLVNTAVGNWIGSPWMIFALFSFLSILLTAAISNAAVIAILLPVCIGMAGRLGIDPMILTYAIAVPAGLDFMFPMGTPAIAIAVSSNYIGVRETVKGGFIMFVASWVVFNLIAAFYWPLIGMGYSR